MLRKTTLASLVLTISFFSTSIAADCNKQSPTFFTVEQQVKGQIDRDIKGSCTLLKHNPNDTILGFSSGYEFGQRTVTYFDPAECDSLVYPFEITGLSFTLLDPPSNVDPRPYKWPVLIDVVVFDMADSTDSCSGPGGELCRISLVCDSITYAFPKVATVTFPTPCCVEQPFFIGIEYTDQGTGPLPSILYDVNSDPDTCHIFQFYCGQWWDWYEFWVIEPGYPFFWVHGETVSLNCCPDLDADSICEVFDNCPDIANPDQADTDGDGIGDSCDTCTDTDGDGFGNPAFPANACPDDNCPYTYNPGQEDADGNGVGDVCDVGCCVDPISGNVDGDGAESVNIADLTYLVDYLFRSGFPPPCSEEGDIDGSGSINVSDVTFLVDYLFRGGPPPAPCP